MSLVVCLPTYDERENLEPMVRALGSVLAEHGLDGRVLVIDDASPDGTGELADELARGLGFVDVLHRERKEGLGPAYIAGFERALGSGAELVATIDCDFSHDPADLPRLVEATARAGIALGSRYVRGGGTENWGALRRLVSRGGSVYARAVLGIPVHDTTSGFKVYRREVLEAIRPARIRSRGYAFQIETVYRALRAGFTVEEVPIRFTDRTEGGSKMGPGIVLEAMARVPALRLAAARGKL
ncbi:MAG TPA: polyprenol monophosphomannose synthase [Gaiellaceae bacterium]|nr:polyprenol monophosphomannose synthase [Gaiellaceae bacterium]